VVNDGVLSYLDFAREAARLVHAPESLIDAVTEREMKRRAPRPRYTPMQANPPLRSWQEALAAYIGQPRTLRD
jgi:dTDP-4-dehydrorhamnose reductase